MRRRALQVIFLMLTVGAVFVGSVLETDGLPTTFATPQPYKSLPDPYFQPWLGGASLGSDEAISGTRATVSYSNLNPTVIQSDNELGAGIAVHGPNIDQAGSAVAAGIDYTYYGFVNVNNGGTITLVSSAWIHCEWTNCPSPYWQATLSACSTGQAGGYEWSTCHDPDHWQLFADRFVCSSCALSDRYRVEMVWVQGNAVWYYYKNDVLWHRVAYTPPSSWKVGLSFKTGSGTHSGTLATWFHFQFGVTSIYPIGSSNWQVIVENPQYQSPSDSRWHQIPRVQAMHGGVAFTDAVFRIGGANYVGMTVAGNSSDCYTKATFSYGSGGTTPSGTDLWNGAGCSTGGAAPSADSPYFDVTVDPNSIVVQKGTSKTAIVSIRSVNGYSGTVNLATYVPLRPYGTSESFSSSSITLSPGATVSSTMTINTDYSTPNSYAITIIGTDNSKYHQLTIPVWVSTPPPPPPTYVYPATFTGGGYSGGWITVCVGTSVSVRITLSATTTFSGSVDVQVRKDIVSWPDEPFKTLSRTVTLNSGNNAVEMGSFTPTDLTGTWPGNVREYFLKVYWAGQQIYEGISGSREWVKTKSCGGGGGGGGGSVPAGSLITMADGTKLPVQNVRVGDTVVVYDVQTGYETTAVVTEIQTFVADSLLTLHTSAGLPFRADANPRMRLHVLVNGQPVLTPITEITVGDQIYNYDLQAWVTVTYSTIAYGGRHLMYDLVTDPLLTSNGSALEYIANGYPDCPKICKV